MGPPIPRTRSATVGSSRNEFKKKEGHRQHPNTNPTTTTTTTTTTATTTKPLRPRTVWFLVNRPPKIAHTPRGYPRQPKPSHLAMSQTPDLEHKRKREASDVDRQPSASYPPITTTTTTTQIQQAPPPPPPPPPPSLAHAQPTLQQGKQKNTSSNQAPMTETFCTASKEQDGEEGIADCTALWLN